jgi:hypothetical protein
MSFDKIDLESLNEQRRKSIAKTIRSVPEEELKQLGEELFPLVDDPWREVYFQYIAENRGSTFHYAQTDDGVHILYCNDRDKGMWFLPGAGKGPLLARGRKAMKEIIEKGR